RLIPLADGASTGSDLSDSLEAPIAPPEAVFVQKTSHPHGNVLVSVQLSREQVELKAADGHQDFIVIGEGSHRTLLRDDGRGVDRTAGDGRFTGVAAVDDAELSARAQHDRSEVSARGTSQVPSFAGRRFAGFVTAEPFDYEAFAAGAEVEIETAVNFLSGGGLQEAEPTSPTAGAARIGGGAKSGARTISAANVTLGTNTFQDRVLMIRDPGVVRDPQRTWDPCTGAGNPDGVWTFKHLMTEMANQPQTGIDPAVFVEQWLRTWAQNPGPTINGTTVSTRAQILQLINDWKAGAKRLDLRRAPFRLLAVVSRVDLATTTGGGGYSGSASGNFLDAGELRFVFGVVLPPGFSSNGYFAVTEIGSGTPSPYEDLAGDTRTCRALAFSVIFEYKVPKCDCEDVRGWAQRLVDLANYAPGTLAYNSRLAALTQSVVRANADPRRPNGNSLGQLRTNEISLPQTSPPLNPPNPPFVVIGGQQIPLPPDVRWEIREFQLTQKPFSMLAETTTADTAADPFNFTPTFGNWILNNVRPAIVAQFNGPIPQVPLFFQGGPFLGANPQVPDPDVPNPTLQIEHHWDGVGLNLADLFTNEARHRASLAACNGCHRGETGTPFVHVDPSSTVLPATISGFLSGINDWPDPAFGAPLRDFDDLARRELDIVDVANMTCGHFPLIDAVAVEAHLDAFGVLPDDPFLPGHGHGLSASIDAMRRNHISEVH
ncbi:MAG TPA: hypothetical protein VHM02_08515, partial [Thermoanaerobaculia bacterium]|nr:hypothetical protein [Thermoanaerobaculia bacterium]